MIFAYAQTLWGFFSGRFERIYVHTSWDSFYRALDRRVATPRVAGEVLARFFSCCRSTLSFIALASAAFIVGLLLSRVSMVGMAGAGRQVQGEGWGKGGGTKGDEDSLMREIKGLKAVKTSHEISPTGIRRPIPLYSSRCRGKRADAMFTWLLINSSSTPSHVHDGLLVARTSTLHFKFRINVN